MFPTACRIKHPWLQLTGYKSLLSICVTCLQLTCRPGRPSFLHISWQQFLLLLIGITESFCVGGGCGVNCGWCCCCATSPPCNFVERRKLPQSGMGQHSAHVYCGQTAGWIKISLGMEGGLGPRHIVLDGDTTQLPPEKKRHTPNIWPMSAVTKRLYGSICHLVFWAISYRYLKH